MFNHSSIPDLKLLLRKFKLKKKVMDAAFDCFDETALHNLAKDTQRTMKENAIEVLRMKVMDRIGGVDSPGKGLSAQRVSRSRSDPPHSESASAGGSSVGGEDTSQSHIPTPWAVRLEELVRSKESHAWKESATGKLANLRFPVSREKNRSFLRNVLVRAVEGSFGALLAGISECTRADEIQTKFAANVVEFRKKLLSKLLTAVKKSFKKKLQVQYSIHYAL
jgi:hypothetical protein